VRKALAADPLTQPAAAQPILFDGPAQMSRRIKLLEAQSVKLKDAFLKAQEFAVGVRQWVGADVLPGLKPGEGLNMADARPAPATGSNAGSDDGDGDGDGGGGSPGGGVGRGAMAELAAWRAAWGTLRVHRLKHRLGQEHTIEHTA